MRRNEINKREINMIYNDGEEDSHLSSGFKITSSETARKINKILFICFLGGVISGMLGVGGGIVMAPLMLELGLEPRVAASTSNFLLIFTSSAGVILFILSVITIFNYFLGPNVV
jgi:uncharacterized membrane protein YfcA